MVPAQFFPVTYLNDFFSHVSFPLVWMNRLARQAGQMLSPADWLPLCDVSEEKEQYVIHVELPGVDISTVQISILDNQLRVSGERTRPTDEEGQVRKLHRAERLFGHFLHHVRLPEDADYERCNAQYRDGVLEIFVARTAPVPAAQVPIAAIESSVDVELSPAAVTASTSEEQSADAQEGAGAKPKAAAKPRVRKGRTTSGAE